MAELTTVIRSAYASLADRERQLADIIMENTSRIAVFSASELARKARVSNPTATRMVKQPGFRNYDQMRRLARREMGSGSPLALFSADESDPAQTLRGNLIERFAEQEIGILRNSLARLDPETIDEITTCLCEAGNLGFPGLRNSHFFATCARWQFLQFREKTARCPAPARPSPSASPTWAR